MKVRWDDSDRDSSLGYLPASKSISWLLNPTSSTRSDQKASSGDPPSCSCILDFSKIRFATYYHHSTIFNSIFKICATFQERSVTDSYRSKCFPCNTCSRYSTAEWWAESTARRPVSPAPTSSLSDYRPPLYHLQCIVTRSQHLYHGEQLYRQCFNCQEGHGLNSWLIHQTA